MGQAKKQMEHFYGRPDYFLVLDADEIVDVETFRKCDRLFGTLPSSRPTLDGIPVQVDMETSGFQVSVVHHHHFGFIRPGVRFTSRRTVTWNEGRLKKLLGIARLPDFSARAFGFRQAARRRLVCFTTVPILAMID